MKTEQHQLTNNKQKKCWKKNIKEWFLSFLGIKKSSDWQEFDFTDEKNRKALPTAQYISEHNLRLEVFKDKDTEETKIVDEGNSGSWHDEQAQRVSCLGVAIFSAVNKYLAKIMNNFPNYDVSMVETHHIHKLDAPSGTAITLAEGILENLDRKNKWVMGTLTAPDGTVTGTTACASDEMPVSAIREGEVPGIHTIRYESEADSIIITHDAKNRKGFALGAVLAAEYTATHEGFLGMNDLFQF